MAFVLLFGVFSVNDDELLVEFELVLWDDPLFELLLEEVGLFAMVNDLCVGLMPLIGRLNVLRFEFEVLLELELLL